MLSKYKCSLVFDRKEFFIFIYLLNSFEVQRDRERETQTDGGTRRDLPSAGLLRKCLQ